MKIKVRLYAPIPNGKGNIYWRGNHGMRAGEWPRSHPCFGNPKLTVATHNEQPASQDPLGRFRARGYFASCFPEGDGICFDAPAGKTTPDIVNDIHECFGWSVEVKRA